MFSPFDSPIGKSLVRMMAETTVFEQQGGQQQGQQGGGGGNPSTANSCYNNNYSSYFQKVYEDSANNYRIYQIWKNNPNGGYQWYSWDSSSAPTSYQITAMKRHLNGLKANGDSRCVLPNNPGFVLLNTSVGQYNGWHTYRDIHESANAGCTDSNSSNYDSTALTLDTSCQFYEGSGLGVGYSKKSQTFGDDVRFESNRKFFRKTLPNNQVDSYFVSTIEKVCTSSRCAVNGAREKTVAWTQTTPTFTWGSNKASYDSANAASKTAIDSAMAELEAGYVPNCTMMQQPSFTYKTEVACDGTQFGITQTNYTSNCSGSVEKIVYSFSNGESYTWEESSGITSSAFKNSTPADSRAGYGGLSDRLMTLVDNHNKGLGTTTEMNYRKKYENSRGVLGQQNGQQLVIVVEAYEVIEDACGKKTQGESQFYGYTYVYDYTPELQIRPVYDGLTKSSGTPIVTYNGAVMPPTTTFGPFEESPSAEDLVGKVVRGCTDPTATNYDEKANTDSTGFTGKCKYPEDDGNGGALADPPIVEPTPTFSPLLLIPAALLAVGLIVKNK
jgi:hypothetical protein